ncbi:MAG: hypothetical protein RSC68_18935, partial [Acinetobacter sp.]
GVYIKKGLRHDLYYPNIHCLPSYTYTVKMNQKLQNNLMNSMNAIDDMKAGRYQEAQMRIPNFDEYDEEQKREIIRIIHGQKNMKDKLTKDDEEEVDYESILADENYKAFKLAKWKNKLK